MTSAKKRNWPSFGYLVKNLYSEWNLTWAAKWMQPLLIKINWIHGWKYKANYLIAAHTQNSIQSFPSFISRCRKCIHGWAATTSFIREHDETMEGHWSYHHFCAVYLVSSVPPLEVVGRLRSSSGSSMLIWVASSPDLYGWSVAPFSISLEVAATKWGSW